MQRELSQTAISPEQILAVAKGVAFARRCHPAIDREDLSGYIAEKLFIAKPLNLYYANWKANKLVSEYHRMILGRNESVKRVAAKTVSINTISAAGSGGYDEVMKADDIFGEYDLAFDAIEENEHNIMNRFMSSLKDDRHRKIVKLRMDGMPMSRIGEEIGVSESRVCQIVNGPIRNSLIRMFPNIAIGDGESKKGFKRCS